MKWLDWVKRLQAIAQAGLTYSKDPFDLDRFRQIREIGAEIASDQSNQPYEKVLHLFAQEKGYFTPKVDTRGVIVNAEGHLLMVKEISTGHWTLPGGWADVWDSPSQAVEREIWEETGLKARAYKLIGVFHRVPPGYLESEYAVYKHYFLCEQLGGEITTSIETTEVAFFPPDALPPIDTQRTSVEHIQRCLVHVQNPTLPTEFD